ncbi:MAG: hypothetical protein WCA46_23715 [Actinocatenispora sp.]
MDTCRAGGVDGSAVADCLGSRQYFWDKPADIERFTFAYESVCGQALDETASTAVIEATAKELASDA